MVQRTITKSREGRFNQKEGERECELDTFIYISIWQVLIYMKAESLSDINSERSNSLLVYLTIFISLADQRRQRQLKCNCQACCRKSCKTAGLMMRSAWSISKDQEVCECAWDSGQNLLLASLPAEQKCPIKTKKRHWCLLDKHVLPLKVE